jgi:CheY-like chemotaxis protein
MKENILVVDDNKDTVEEICRALKSKEYNVDFSYSGEGCLKKITKNRYDVIILDWIMKKIDGLKVLETIDQNMPFSKVIMISAYKDQKLLERALKFRAFDFLDKPVKKKKLIESVEKAVEKNQLYKNAVKSFVKNNPKRSCYPIKIKFNNASEISIHSAKQLIEILNNKKVRYNKKNKPVKRTNNNFIREREIKQINRVKTANKQETFDVFLCYNRKDKQMVKKIAKLLILYGIVPWFDEWNIKLGCSWIDQIEEQLNHIKAAAIFIGENGSGPWQRSEINAILQKCKDKNLNIIPILLPKSKKRPKLPLFLREYDWIDFKKLEAEPLAKILWGITGKKIILP